MPNASAVLQHIERAAVAGSRVDFYVQIAHRRAHVGVTHQGLQRADVHAVLQDVQHFSIQIQQRVKGLILRRGAYLVARRQRIQKRFYIAFAHVFWMTFVVEQDIPPHPADVTINGALAVMPSRHLVADFIQQLSH